jgi:hypothetical protein
MVELTANVSVAGVVPLAGVTVMKLPRLAIFGLGAKEALKGMAPVLDTATV